MKTKEELKNMKLSELVEYYNARTTGPQIKKFRDRKTAILRVSQLDPNPPKPKKAVAKPRKERKKQARKLFELRPQRFIKPHREGTARAKAVQCLLGEGATFEEVQAATGWTIHARAYEGIRLLNTALGYGIREKNGVISLYLDAE